MMCRVPPDAIVVDVVVVVVYARHVPGARLPEYNTGEPSAMTV